MATVFFDIRATLADVSAAPDGSLTFRPRPRVLDVLDALADIPLAAGFTRAGFGAAVPSPETVDSVRTAVTPSAIRRHIARISGAAPLVEGEEQMVTSRDVSNPGNMVVVDALAARLHSLGLAVTLQPFTWRGHRLANVVAEHRVEGSAGAVLVTAHVDSTAAYGDFFDRAGVPRPYDPRTDPAPGADDDGSGTAAVLAAAECLSTMVSQGRTLPGDTVNDADHNTGYAAAIARAVTVAALTLAGL